MSDEDEKLKRGGRVEDHNYVPSTERRFGQIGDFWSRYDRLAGETDKEMSKNLNGNLDVLLIFAGLFSAVNTAFISLSIPSLSPNSSDETNNLLRLLVLRVDNGTISPTDLSPPFSPAPASVIANCFLLSSLCFSLLAAVGAMLGKEWLQNYDRTVPPGLLDEQGRHRQQKYDAAKQWHLEETVQFLPNILLFSVLLFLVGLIQLLLPMNKVVAGFVIALVGMGTILSLATIGAGTISQYCPYQNALSRWLRWISWRVASKRGALGRSMRRACTSLMLGICHLSQFQFRRLEDILHLGGASGTHVATVGPPSSISEAEEDQIMIGLLKNFDYEGRMNFRAAYWILSTTTNLDNRRVVAQNMCNLTAQTCYIMGKDLDAWRYLLLMTFEALIHWNAQPGDANSRVSAEQCGVALYHSLAGYSPQSKPWKLTQTLLTSCRFQSQTGSLDALEFIFRRPSNEIRLVDVVRRSDFANLDFRLRKAIIYSELLFTDEQISWDLITKFLGNKYDDGILSMLAFYIVRRYHVQEHVGNAPVFVPDIQDRANWRVQLLEAYDGENLDRNILGALDASVLAFDKSLESWDGPAKIYITFIKILQNLHISSAITSSSFVKSLIKLVTKVEWKNPGDVAQTRLIVETLRVIRFLTASQIPIGPFQNEVSLALWCGLDHIVQVATTKDKAADIDFEEAIFGALDLDAKSRESNSLHAARIEDHPRVVAWLVSKVGGFPSATRRWLKLMRKFETDWFGSNLSVQQVWIDYRLGYGLLASFRTIQNGDDLFLMSPIFIRLILFESAKSRQQLVEAGFVSAMTDMVIRICRDRERFDAARWRDCAHLVLQLFFQVWEFAERDQTGGVTNDKMVLAFKNMLPILESNLRREQDGGTGFHGQLLHFAEYIQQRRGVSALLSHSFDVALNRLFAEADKKVEWGYQSYGQPRAPSCTLRDFVNDGLS